MRRFSITPKKSLGLKFVTRQRSASDVFTDAGDQHRTERHPERTTKPGFITLVGVVMTTSKYSGTDLRRIRREKGVGHPPRKIAGQVEGMYQRWRSLRGL